MHNAAGSTVEPLAYTFAMSLTADDLVAELMAEADPRVAATSRWFFKTAEGEYGEGDVFVGLKVPTIRRIALPYRDLGFDELDCLLDSEVHEYRFAALAILVSTAKHRPADTAEFYLAAVRRGRVNNWDLVDLSAEKALGDYLIDRPRDVLFGLAQSEIIWERRVSIIATFSFLKRGDPSTTLQLAELLVTDEHDLMRKAVGWMLRETGKRVDRVVLLQFLDRFAARMPRTMLSYAIEHLPPERKSHYRSLT